MQDSAALGSNAVCDSLLHTRVLLIRRVFSWICCRACSVHKTDNGPGKTHGISTVPLAQRLRIAYCRRSLFDARPGTLAGVKTELSVKRVMGRKLRTKREKTERPLSARYCSDCVFMHGRNSLSSNFLVKFCIERERGRACKDKQDGR